MPREGSVIIGTLAGAHGLRGEVRFNSYLAGNLDLSKVRELTLVLPGSHPEQRRLTGVRIVPKGFLLTFEGIESREEAEKLKGAEVLVDSRLLPPAGEGEYYWHDLIGLKVETVEGKPVGIVKGLAPGGGQDLLVVDMGSRETLIPAVEPIIVSVDIEKGRIVVDAPEGLLDE